MEILGLATSIALASLAYRLRMLRLRGALSAAVVGSVASIVKFEVFVILLVFFTTSSLLTRLGAQLKAAMSHQDISGRSIRQVVGVGTPIVTFLVLYAYTRDSAFLYAAVSSIAYSTADTWASEVGMAVGGTPRLITKPWVRVPPGTSGGVTVPGYLASISGSVFISSISAALLGPAPIHVIMLMGMLGEILDSVIGAVAQRKYVCGGEVYDYDRGGCTRVGYLSNEAVNLVTGFVIGALTITILKHLYR